MLGGKVGLDLFVTMSGRCLAFVRFGIHDTPISLSSPSVHAGLRSLGGLETWHGKDELRLCHWLEETPGPRKKESKNN